MKDFVKIEVLEVRPSGVLVKILDDNRVGFIRRRELSWDRRVGFIPSMPEVGEQFEAVVIRDRKGARNVELSIRRKTDPWQNANKYYPGQVVRGEVINIRRFGAFAQLEPGIDAIIWPKNAPLLRNQHLAEALSIGDQIQGVITQIDLEKQRMEINLNDHLRALSIAPHERLPIQRNLFQESLARNTTQHISQYIPKMPDHSVTYPCRYHPPIPKPEKILAIDDNETFLQEICAYLDEAFAVPVDGVKSGKEALDEVRKGLPYSLALIDIKLMDEHGAKVAEELLNLKPDLAVIFTSADPLAEDELLDINGRGFPFAIKTSEDIADWVEKLCNGYWTEVHEPDNRAYTGSGSFIHQLGMTALARRTLPEMLSQLLTELRLKTETSQTMVLEVNSINKRVSVVATEPPLNQFVLEHSLDGLYYSPVRTVVEDEETFYAVNIKRDDPQFKYFFPLLEFKVCFGIPLSIPDHVTRYALFLFDEGRSELEIEAIDQARLTAQFIQIALERALLLNYMRRYEQRYTQGQLLGSLVHEIKNKLDGLDGNLKTLPVLLDKASTSIEITDRSNYLTKAVRVAEEVAQTKNELRQLVNAYSRMIVDDVEAVDVNAIAHKVQLQLRTKAHETGIEIYLKTANDLPLAYAVHSRLEQILMNLVLNAIQQIERQSKLMARIARETGEKTPLLQEGLIIIQTCHNEAETPYPIQIFVIDTGPGIPYDQREKIFLLDTSARKGTGMGLFISRNLVETMGGRLYLLDSLIFIGSIFVVELPTFSVTRAHP